MKAHRVVSLAVLVGLFVGTGATLAQSPGQTLPEEIAKLRHALDKYQDPAVAVRDGYFSTVGCIEEPTGGMGIHFLNLKLVGPVPDPMRPAILLYEPDGNKFRLVGVEWFVPLATGVKERPSLFGQPFDGPMEGHEPLMPAELHHYDLHVWLFKPNPAGMFKATNPDLRCPKTGFSFFVEHPKTVPHR